MTPPTFPLPTFTGPYEFIQFTVDTCPVVTVTFTHRSHHTITFHVTTCTVCCCSAPCRYPPPWIPTFTPPIHVCYPFDTAFTDVIVTLYCTTTFIYSRFYYFAIPRFCYIWTLIGGCYFTTVVIYLPSSLFPQRSLFLVTLHCRAVVRLHGLVLDLGCLMVLILRCRWTGWDYRYVSCYLC